MQERDFKEEGGIIDFPNLQPKRFFLNFDPPQIGLLYNRSPSDSKKHIFLVQLNKLVLKGDPLKITEEIFEKYPAFYCDKVVNKKQVLDLVTKIMDYISNLIQQFQDDEEGQSESVEHVSEPSFRKIKI